MTTDEPSLPADLVAGAGAGTAATVVMSAVMLAADKLGLSGELPPEAIVEAGLDAAAIDRSERTENALASVAHLAFGASCGSLYALARRVRRPSGRGILPGVAFGLGVYAVSYLGWIPALGILPPAHRDRSGRQDTMVLGHVVYGAVLGAVLERRRSR